MENVNIAELMRERRSVRTYDGNEISAEHLEKLSSYMAEIDNPYHIPIEFKLLDAKRQGLKCPVVSGTNLFVGAKLKRVPHGEEALGYSFERLVLYAQSLGIGTVWIGGTMDRKAFERAMELDENEVMPCVSPLGYPAKKLSLQEGMMRKAVKADSRLEFDKIFFDATFDTPLTEEKAGRLLEPLEMVRLAPSAVNKQPWRAVVDKDAVHFYLKKNKGFVSEPVGDMQKIDLGIALCHFALTAEKNGINTNFATDDPGISTESNTEYIATYEILG